MEGHTERRRPEAQLRRPQRGDLLHITRAASVQFISPFVFRVVRCLDYPTYYGWIWLDGEQLGAGGKVVARREIFVQLAGLRSLLDRPGPAAGGRRNERAVPRPAGAGVNRRAGSAGTPRAADTPKPDINESLTFGAVSTEH